MIRSLVAAALASLVLAGCGGGGDTSAAPAEKESASASPTEEAYDPDTATETEKWDEYQRLLDVANVTDPDGMSQTEAPEIAENTCDNTQADFRDFLDITTVLYKGAKYDDSVTARKIFTRAYCPEKEAVLDAARASAEEAKEAEANIPKKKDWVIKLKIRSKECFGSAGCNVGFQIDPQYLGFADVSTGTYDITYRVDGGEDGPMINTFQLEDGQASFPSEELASTPSSTTKLRARVISVDPVE